MSRIGNKVILIPTSVTVTLLGNNEVMIKGPKGELKSQFNQNLEIKHENGQIEISRPNNDIFMRKIHGTTRALLANMVTGVTEGFKKQLEIKGVGYRAAMNGNKLSLSVGYSHPVEFDLPEGIKVDLPKNTDIIISGIDKQAVGDFAANIRAVRKPEPYKGKGIRYIDEYVRRKAGKTAK